MRILFALLLTCSLAFAQSTLTWRQSRFEEFQKGTAKGVAIRSDGMLELAPAFKQHASTPSSYIWSMASDADGNAFVAAGSPARVYRIAKDGKVSIIFAPSELQVQAVAVDASGLIYAATSPDGKVYKITRGKSDAAAQPVKLPPDQAPAAKSADPHLPGESKPAAKDAATEVPVDSSYTSSVFFEPRTKYIWDLKLDAEGRLYVATGDRGEIFRVNLNGDGARFFKSDEAHIRSLAFSPDGALIAGSDGSGLVYRITQSGEGFVLYSAAKKEITALAVDAKGNIYAAGIGEKRPGVSTATVSPLVNLAPQMGVGIVGMQPQMQIAQPMPVPPAFSTTSRGAEIYLIPPQAAPQRIWSSREDLVYSLAFDSAGRLLAGSGNSGRIYRIDGRGDYADLLKVTANQVAAFAPAPNGGLYAATSNLGKLFVLSNEPADEGSFESDVFDAKILSRWGRVEVRGSGSFDVYLRSGNVDNPDRNWSPWKLAESSKDMLPDLPPARFVQWRAVLRPSGARLTGARVETVAVNYRPANVAPVVEEVYVQPGARYNVVPRPPESSAVQVGPPPTSSVPMPIRIDPVPPALRDRNSVAVRWVASDENDDDLTFSVYFRGDGEARWKLLKADIAEKQFSWEAGLLPDGGYAVRVVASDAKSRGPEEALTAARESARFEVDSTPPLIEALQASVEGDQVHVTFRARDSFSPIRRAEYSINAGEWRPVEPVGLLSDSLIENYDFTALVEGPRTLASAAAQTVTPPSENKEAKGKPKKGKARKPEAAAALPDTASQAPAPEGMDETALAAGEHVIVVRAFDRFDNMGSAKILVRK